MKARIVLAAVIGTVLGMVTGVPGADTTIPTADLKGAKDSPVIGRYQGSFIVSSDRKDYEELTLPLSKLERVQGKKDNHNNHAFEPRDKKLLEGARTRLVYVLPDGVSPLEALRNYQEEIKNKGGEVLYECKEQECGGDPGRSSEGGGGEMSLAMLLRPQEHVKDAHFTNGHCAQTTRISGQRYSVGMLPESGTHVSVLAYTAKECAFKGRTIAVVDILEPKQRQQKMVTIKAEEMAKKISTIGSIALYGIYFDFNKAEVKSESGPTLEQIAKLLKDDPKLKLLVVGHTDNVGALPLNMDLSQRRAAAVVNALATQFSIDRNRLSPVGVAFACPVASNRTEEGRAKNRRVELVEN